MHVHRNLARTAVRLLPYPVDYFPYTVTHVWRSCNCCSFQHWRLLASSERPVPAEMRTLNIWTADWFYRWLGPRALKQLTHVFSRWHVRTRIGFLRHLGNLFGTLFLYHGPQGILARTWATGSMVLWVVILLGIYLIAYYY